MSHPKNTDQRAYGKLARQETPIILRIRPVKRNPLPGREGNDLLSNGDMRLLVRSRKTLLLLDQAPA